MFDKGKKSFGLILIGLTMLAGLFGCSDSSSNAPTETNSSSNAPTETDSSSSAPEESDRIVDEVGTGTERCKALSIECGYGYDYQAVSYTHLRAHET